MKRVTTFLATTVVLWLPLTITCLLAPAVAAIGLLAWLLSVRAYDYTKNLLGGMDRCASGLLGLNARYTVSAHCGAMTKPWLRPLRIALDAIAPGHCEGAAVKEEYK